MVLNKHTVLRQLTVNRRELSSGVPVRGEMVRSAVRVVLRTRPTDKFASDCIDLQDDGRSVAVHLPKAKKKKDNFVNHQQDAWSFCYDSILHNASQESVFSSTVQPIVKSFFEGYNATIMAYGQTGAGKTYTMCGGDDFRQRGLAPRGISEVYQQIANRPEQSYEVRVSYMEIYNEHLYDLLGDTERTTEDISIQEDSKGQIYVRGLNMKAAPQEADAMSHFFEGNANRVIADHKLNASSTRSHCIWTVYLSSRSRVESDGHTTHSKLHFVDLAGSERIAKTGSDGQIMKEAMYINKSLTFLEQVVMALSTAGRDHVPYRQTKLTNFLKDALGGNCKTTMIANIWTEEAHIDETISTLKFAQRMMRVQNEATINLSIDAEAQIRKMARDIQELKSELQMQNQLHGKSHVTYGEDLTDDEKFVLQKGVRDYIDGVTPEIDVKTIRQVKAIFKIFKTFVQNAEVEARQPGTAPATAMTDKNPKPGSSIRPTEDGVGEVKDDDGFGVGTAVPVKLDRQARPEASSTKATQQGSNLSAAATSPVHVDNIITNVELPDRNQCYDDFNNNDGYQFSQSLRQAQARLKEKKKEYRDAGLDVNTHKQTIDDLKLAVEQKRQEHDNIGVDEEILDQEEYKLLQHLKETKQEYKAAYGHMQNVKTERDYASKMVDQSRTRLMSEFDKWYESNYGAVAAQHAGIPSIGRGAVTQQYGTGGRVKGSQQAAAMDVEDPGQELDDPESSAYYAAKRAAQLNRNSTRNRTQKSSRWV